MQDSIFTKIIKGDIPSHKIYEDADTFVLLDIYPIQPGQVLVVPKKQVGFVWDLEPADYAALMSTVQKIGKQLHAAYPEKSRVGVIVEGLDVADHAHVKVFAFNNDEEFRHVPDRSIEPNHDDLAAIAAKLRIADEL